MALKFSGLDPPQLIIYCSFCDNERLSCSLRYSSIYTVYTLRNKYKERDSHTRTASEYAIMRRDDLTYR